MTPINFRAEINSFVDFSVYLSSNICGPLETFWVDYYPRLTQYSHPFQLGSKSRKQYLKKNSNCFFNITVITFSEIRQIEKQCKELWNCRGIKLMKIITCAHVLRLMS